MKKLLFVAIGLLSFCSCRQQNATEREYSCQCSNGDAHVIKATSVQQATQWCDTYDNVCPPGVQCVTSWDCNLN